MIPKINFHNNRPVCFPECGAIIWRFQCELYVPQSESSMIEQNPPNSRLMSGPAISFAHKRHSLKGKCTSVIYLRFIIHSIVSFIWSVLYWRNLLS